MADEFMISGIDTSSWTDEQRAELRAATEAADKSAGELSDILSEDASPSAIIAERKKLAERAARSVREARALSAAQKKWGESEVRAHETRTSMIIMHTPTKAHDAELLERYRALSDAGRKDEADIIWTDGVIACCDYPPEPEVRAEIERYPRLEETLTIMYGQLASGASDRLLGK